MAKRKITTAQLAFDFDAPAEAPDADAIAAGWSALRRFHAAVVNYGPAGQTAAREDLKIAAAAVDGDCQYDREIKLLDALRAPDDTAPLFG